jgi:hypothetical protein
VHERDGGAKVRLFARAGIKRAGTSADATKIETQRGHPDAGRRLGGLIQRLGVHRAAMQRMRVAEHRHRARLATWHVEQRFERARRARNLTQHV